MHGNAITDSGTAALRSWAEQQIEKAAARAYNAYCSAVGAVDSNGGALPTWEVFAADPARTGKVAGWRAAARAATAIDLDWSDLDPINLIGARYILKSYLPPVFQSEDAPGLRFTILVDIERASSQVEAR